MASKPRPARQNDKQPAVARSIQVRPDGTLTVRDAAAVLGLSPVALRKWFDNGCPYNAGGQGRTNPATVTMMHVIEWRAGNDEDLDLQRDKAREQKLKVIKLEADVRRTLGMLVPVDILADVIDARDQQVRSSLNSIPGRAAIKAAAETDVNRVRRIIADAIAEALAQMTQPDATIRKAGGDPDRSAYEPIEIAGFADEAEDDDVDA